MDNPGDYPLYTGPITAALSRSTGVQPWLAVDLSGLTAVSLIGNFKYGSGGAVAPNGCSAIIQAGSTVDDALALDICRFDFGQASKIRRCNLEGLLSVANADYADLAADGVTDGLLLNRLRAVLLVGTAYVNTTLSIIAGCR